LGLVEALFLYKDLGHMSQAIAFIDVGFLRAQGADSLGVSQRNVAPDAEGCVTRLRELAAEEGSSLLRVYWYDGAFDADHQRYQGQRTYLNAIASCPGIQIRLGHIREDTPSWHHALKTALTACGVNLEEFEKHYTFRPEREQKGVDTLIVLDLVRLAQRRAYETAFLIAGDRDLAEAVRVVQDEGRRLILLHPNGGGVATELRHLADEVKPLSESELRQMLRVK